MKLNKITVFRDEDTGVYYECSGDTVRVLGPQNNNQSKLSDQAFADAVRRKAADVFLTARGPIDASHSLTVDLGDYTFSIQKNPNNWFASGWIVRKDGTPTPCVMSWKSAWGSTSQWYTYNWTQDVTPVATDTDLGYGATPSRGGSHIVIFMDCVSYKLWNITCMIGGNIDSSADFGSIIVDATGAQ